ncbi:MAG: molybdopterin cofactor-binding domain-containing protein [Candidatus Aminicenantes bacterium]
MKEKTRKDEYQNVYLELRDAVDQTYLNRREFLKLLGGGIMVLYSVKTPEAFMQETQRRRFGRGYPDDFNAYLRIKEDGRVDCFTGKIEMGQGIVTSLAQILAEELDVTLDTVDMVMGDTDLCPWDMGTFGSLSIEYFGPPLRAAAAEARAILIQLASEKLRLSQDRLITKEGMVFDKINPEKRLSYADLSRGKRIERHLKGEPPLTPPSDFTVCGKPESRTDALEKVTGEARYTGDIQIPGMLQARILRPPAHGAVLKRVDTSGAEKMKGVQVIREGDMIAVLHRSFDQADRALARIKARYQVPEPKVNDQTIFKHLLEAAPEGEVVEQQGNINKGKKLASVVFEKTYLNRYLAHAAIEPHTAVAEVKGNKATVWASTQTPFRAQEEVAQTLGIPSENVRIITPFVGGGFGGKTRNQQVVEAARLSKLTGKPVQVAWSRKEEFFYDSFQPTAVVEISSGLDDSDKIVFWDYQVFYAGERSSQPFYDIPHYRIVSRGGWMRPDRKVHPFAVGAWRGPGSNTNTFARELHMDLMASEAGMDPLEFRMKNLTDKRMTRVLETVAQKFGWTPAKTPSGRGYGLACVDYLGTYVAAMAEVEVDEKRGNIKVKRVVSAQDMGRVINPEGARAQMEGGITMGLGYALREEIHFEGGKIHDLNFDTYEIPRFSWVPKIETVLVDNPELNPQGGGEPAITPMGGVIANAVYDAAGVRLDQLPMTPERIKKATK